MLFRLDRCSKCRNQHTFIALKLCLKHSSPETNTDRIRGRTLNRWAQPIIVAFQLLSWARSWLPTMSIRLEVFKISRQGETIKYRKLDLGGPTVEGPSWEEQTFEGSSCSSLPWMLRSYLQDCHEQDYKAFRVFDRGKHWLLHTHARLARRRQFRLYTLSIIGLMLDKCDIPWLTSTNCFSFMSKRSWTSPGKNWSRNCLRHFNWLSSQQNVKGVIHGLNRV